MKPPLHKHHATPHRPREKIWRRSFTLIELLIVIAIVAIIMAIIVLLLNPAQLLAQARDSNRLSDYDTINRAFNLLGIDTNQVFGVASTTYISIPDPTAPPGGNTCSGVTGLPQLPPNWSYHCAPTADYRKVNGTGWLPINFSSSSIGAPFGALPVDPVNKGESFYAYVAGNNRYVFTIPLDSNKYLSAGKLGLRDQGTDPTRLESGTDLLLWARATGIRGYWPLDEGEGVTSRDVSEYNNPGLIGGNTFWMGGSVIGDPSFMAQWTSGKIGNGLRFDGINDFSEVQVGALLFGPDFGTGSLTYSLWANFDTVGNSYGQQSPWGKGGAGLTGYRFDFDQTTNILTANITSGIGNSAESSYTYNFRDGQWHHLVGVVDRTQNRLTLYVDGIAQPSAGISGIGSLSSGAVLKVGDEAFSFKGILDEIRLYERPLNAIEVKKLYDATK